MRLRLWTWAFALAAILATAAVLPLATTIKSGRQFFRFKVDLTSTAKGRAQVFFDVGRGFNEDDSTTLPVSIQTTPTRLEFLLPTETIRALRLDPIDHSGEVTLSKLAITGPSGRVVKRFRPSDVIPQHEIATATPRGDAVVVVTTPNANDPNLEIHLASPLKLKVSVVDAILSLLGPWTLWFVALLAAMALCTARRIAQALSALQTCLASRPILTLGIVSTLAVLIQCHPVIFAGRSFVSPNNGSTFYYETFPTLPGSTDVIVENVRGSDVAAMFHNSLYYPSIQREALFKHHEFPLWNRYSVCGIPLFGQGQSMFGSILNFIPLIGDSSAVSWDIRYLVNRWLFAFGLGLTVWLLTRSLPSAAIVAFGGVFIGFFFFRVNHMAQFGVESAPWILVGWILLRDARERRAEAGALVVLAFANWEVINSGTVKEAWVLLGSMDAAGLLMVLGAPMAWREKRRALLQAITAGLVILAVCAPLFWCVYRTMRNSYTVSDQATVAQMPTWQMLGFFDDIFYSRLGPAEWSRMPSINMLFLCGMGWAIVALRRVWKRPGFVPVTVLASAAFAIVFTLIPGRWLLHIPFLRNIGHTHNTFSCVLVVLVPVLAGSGFSEAIAVWREGRWPRHALASCLVVAAPIALYFLLSWKLTGSPFFVGYVWMLGTAVIALHVALLNRDSAAAGVRLISLCAVGALLLWRHGQYIRTPFDTYVFNPGHRADFRAPSAAATIVNEKMNNEPSRPAGLNVNLFGGYNEMLGWESIYGIDALRNQKYDTLMAAGGVSKLFWPIPDTLRSFGGDPSSFHEEHMRTLLPLQNMLNIRFYLATRGTSPPPEGLTFIASADLDVYESAEAWPRAFFTDYIGVHKNLHAFINRLKNSGDHRPFASLTDRVFGSMRVPVTKAASMSREVNPAHHYTFTSNTTGFTVDAPGPGIAVLTESDYADDFEVTVNGTTSPYVPVNHAFKGVFLAQAGTYEIQFAYWPRHLGVAFAIAGAGLVGGLLGLGFLCRGKRPAVTPA